MAAKRSLPFEEARDIVRLECIGSRKQYTDWHKANKPKKIPRFPNRAYEDLWEGWNDFLGNDNSFDNTPKPYRPFAEGMAWAHRLGLKGQQEWLEYVRNNREGIPDDIPTRPDVVYDDWLSWMHWLGNRPQEKVEAAQQVEKQSSIFYCIQEKQYKTEASNIFTFGIERGGVSALKENWELTNKSFYVVRMFHFDSAEMEAVQSIIQRQTTGHYGSNKVRITPNVNQLLYDIGNLLMVAQVR